MIYRQNIPGQDTTEEPPDFKRAAEFWWYHIRKITIQQCLLGVHYQLMYVHTYASLKDSVSHATNGFVYVSGRLFKQTSPAPDSAPALTS